MIKTITAVIQFLRLWAACQAMVLALAVRDKAFPPVVVPMPNFFTASAKVQRFSEWPFLSR